MTVALPSPPHTNDSSTFSTRGLTTSRAEQEQYSASIARVLNANTDKLQDILSRWEAGEVDFDQSIQEFYTRLEENESDPEQSLQDILTRWDAVEHKLDHTLVEIESKKIIVRRGSGLTDKSKWKTLPALPEDAPDEGVVEEELPGQDKIEETSKETLREGVGEGGKASTSAPAPEPEETTSGNLSEDDDDDDSFDSLISNSSLVKIEHAFVQIISHLGAGSRNNAESIRATIEVQRQQINKANSLIQPSTSNGTKTTPPPPPNPNRSSLEASSSPNQPSPPTSTHTLASKEEDSRSLQPYHQSTRRRILDDEQMKNLRATVAEVVMEEERRRLKVQTPNKKGWSDKKYSGQSPLDSKPPLAQDKTDKITSEVLRAVDSESLRYYSTPPAIPGSKSNKMTTAPALAPPPRPPIPPPIPPRQPVQQEQTPAEIWVNIERSNCFSIMANRPYESEGTPQTSTSNLALPQPKHEKNLDDGKMENPAFNRSNTFLPPLPLNQGHSPRIRHLSSKADSIASTSTARPAAPAREMLSSSPIAPSDKSRLPPTSSPSISLGHDGLCAVDVHADGIESLLDNSPPDETHSPKNPPSLQAGMARVSFDDSAQSRPKSQRIASSDSSVSCYSSVNDLSPRSKVISPNSLIRPESILTNGSSSNLQAWPKDQHKKPSDDTPASNSHNQVLLSATQSPSSLPIPSFSQEAKQNQQLKYQQSSQQARTRGATLGASLSSRPQSSTDSIFLENKGIKTYLEEEDIEFVEEETIIVEQTSLFGIRRRLVGEFENLGGRQSRPLSSKPSIHALKMGDEGISTVEENSQKQWNLTLSPEKEMRKREEALEAREKNLTIEALSKAEMAYVKIEIWTESRRGRWTIRGPVSDDGYPPEELPQITDVWAIPIDSKGIVRRKKLKSNVEMSSTRTVVECPDCSQARKIGISSHCRTCDDYGRVEMVYSIQCIVRLAQFLPLKLPAIPLLGSKQSHIKYIDAIDPGQRIDILRDRAMDGLQSAAGRVVKAHYARHGSRLLMGRATITRRGLLTVSVTSSKNKNRRIFDVEDGPDGKVVEVTRVSREATTKGNTGIASVVSSPGLLTPTLYATSPRSLPNTGRNHSEHAVPDTPNKALQLPSMLRSPSSSSPTPRSPITPPHSAGNPHQSSSTLQTRKTLKRLFYR